MSNLVFIGDLGPYKEQIRGVRKKQYQRLLQQADRYEAYQLPEHHPKESTTYLGVAIMNLALAYSLSGEDKYLFQAKRFMGAVLSYEQWGNAHLVNVDLSASWILFGLSLGYDWLKPFLGEEEKEKILAKIRHHADLMYQYKLDTYGHGWSTSYYQNHNWINMTGLAAAGYALSESYDKAVQYTEEAKKNFGRVFSLLADDGSNYEGVPYWRYGGMWLFVYAHLLKVQEGLDYFQTSNYLKNTFYYRLYQSCGDLEQQMNFGDSHDRHSGHAPCVYYKAAAEYGDGFAQTFANLVLDEFLMAEAEKSKIKPGILPEAAFEFLWYDPQVTEKPLSLLPKVRYFEDLGLLSIREDWSRRSKVLTIKCGCPGGRKQWMNGWNLYRREGLDCLSLSHHHSDNLSYIFARGSEYLTCEDGYNRNLMPDNHNVILVDNQYTDAENVNDIYMSSAQKRLEKDPFYPMEEKYRGDVVFLELDDTMVIYKGETSGIYPEALGMKEVSRLLFTDQLFFFLFVDVCVSDRDHIYRIISNTDMPAQKQNDHTYYYPMETGGITYTVFSDQEISSDQYTQEIVSVMTSQEPDKLCRTFINTLSFQSAAPTKKQTLIQCFTFDGMNTEITFKGENLHIRHGDKDYQLIFGNEMNVTIIEVCSNSGERKSYRVP
ncbi:DUF4962 domain-containing protein [Lacrimispora saccharolytica]|uniref:Heparinase II N-terminal domain-containing protein n=1 Tax=Lacrimispora saccharolytica (strain ATCC 35040 / DSM 2544 / NRCC 2533 / WM1) TaxID=610130 RepID=D9R0U8_LACSW|nr:DUF4962 domain-containing protein [Lacrimispora saccharolytica]ADL02747.1 conserved hypothetical protein [[Clostridium] saccharolyticum WM1]QRV19037.1 DUF4962 domain-containing protein [Lacrimispora saccharolytica]